MSKSNWIKYVAFVGIIFVIISIWGAWKYWDYRREHTSEREYAAKHDTSEHQKDRELSCKLIGKAEVRCSLQTPDTEAADEHTKADLKAQQDVAEWSFLTMLFSIVGIVLSAAAVAFTGWAALAAAQAAKAATDVIYLERAWICYDRIVSFNSYEEPEGVFIDIYFSNSGRSPAQNCLAGLAYDGLFGGINLSSGIFPAHPTIKGRAVVGPGRDFLINRIFIPREYLDDIKDRRKEVIFCAQITYTDVFQPKETRMTEIWRRVTVSGLKRDPGSDEYYTAVGVEVINGKNDLVT